MMIGEKRDERLGAALRKLEVPEHRPQFFEELQVALARKPARVRPWLLAPAAAVAAVIAIALGFALTRGSDVASAAQVRAAVEHALASTRSISGVFVNNETGKRGAAGVRWRFVVGSSGAFRIDGVTAHTKLVYDPARNIEAYSDGPSFVRRTGLAPGPPDAAPADFVTQRGLGSVVAALATARDPKVEDVTYSGRRAWLLRTGTGNRGEQRLVTVDRETGIPVRNEVLRNGKLVAEWRIERLQVSPAAPTIRPLAPAQGQAQMTYDAGFRRIPLADARRKAGYSPLVPRRLPAGFELSGVAFARSSRTTGGEDGGNPPSRDVLALSYRRGFERIVVTTRRTVTGPAAWRDPLQVSQAVTTNPRRVVFSGGALKGSSGFLVLEPDAFPHVWIAGPRLVVTIAGNVAPGEVLRAAKSLARR